MRALLSSFLCAMALVIGGAGCRQNNAPRTLFQLNWLHDPTFAGEYSLALDSTLGLSIREGGPNIFPVAEVLAGRANLGVVGADIFLQALDKDLQAGKQSNLRCVFVDFQRNPVGWVLHPDAAAKAGLESTNNLTPAELNQWLFSKFADGTLKPGDKRGTETTAIWIKWKKMHALSEDVKVVPVGFDASIVLSAPMITFPVYLNEEPFKLTEKIGRPVLVFDPAVDEVVLYGNVVITSKEFFDKNPSVVRAVQRGLRKAWTDVKLDLDGAVARVAAVYKGVGPEVLRRQIDKTLEFVFFETQTPGVMEMGESGRWAKTVEGLKDAGILSSGFGLKTCIASLVPPE